MFYYSIATDQKEFYRKGVSVCMLLDLSILFLWGTTWDDVPWFLVIWQAQLFHCASLWNVFVIRGTFMWIWLMYWLRCWIFSYPRAPTNLLWIHCNSPFARQFWHSCSKFIGTAVVLNQCNAACMEETDTPIVLFLLPKNFAFNNYYYFSFSDGY